MKQQKKNKATQSKQSFSEKLNAFFDKYEKGIVLLSMILGALMCLLLFDVKVSLSGDDSDYIIFAENFWKHFTYPSYHGALYPIVLSPFVGLFGYNLVLLKIISCIFMLAFLWLFYKAFKGKVANVILLPALLLVSINSYVFFFASQTYSEALFMLIQGLFFFYLIKHFVDKKEETVCLKTDWKKYIILGLIILLMGLTRSIGYAAIGVLILYFTIKRQWKTLLYSIVAFAIIFILFHLFKSIVWPASSSGGGYDMNSLLAKDYYNPVERETFSGFFERFKENSMIYLSGFLYQFMGLIEETPSNYLSVDPFRTILIYLLFIVALVVVLYKKKNALLITGLYVGVMSFFSFIILHTIWGQERIIMVYYPFILLFLLGGIYYLFQIKSLKRLFFIYPLIIAVIFIGTFSITKNRIARNIPVLQQNILGDQLYGLTPDWQNFIKASEWAAQNLDPDANIISRKATISKVYTGRDFQGDPQAVTVPVDSLLQLKNANEYTLLLVPQSNKYVFNNPYFKYLIGAKDNSLIVNNQPVMAAFLYIIPNDKVEDCVQYLNESQMEYSFDYDSFIESCKKVSDQLRIFDPDMMSEYLINNKINYLLLAQLRSDPTQNTGVYLNNIHRFAWYISIKYPNAFRRVHTVGKEEPCEIVQFIPQR